MSSRYISFFVAVFVPSFLNIQMVVAQRATPESILRLASESMRELEPLNMEVTYLWFDEGESDTHSDIQVANYLKQGDNVYSSIAGRIMIFEGDKVVMLFEEAETVILQPYNEALYKQFSQLPIDSLFTQYESVTIQEESDISYLFECRLADPTYDRLLLEINKEDLSLSKAILYFSNWEGTQPRLEMHCNYLAFPSQQEISKEFSMRHIIRNPGPNASLTARYQSFEFHNQFAQP